jgi:saccharopepsin
LRIAGVEVTSQPFINVASARPIGFIGFYYGYDGVLGLAPRWDHHSIPTAPTTTATRLTSPWSSIVRQSLLPANLFALELPSGVMDTTSLNRWGELSLGGISPKYASAPFSYLPLSTYSSQVWAVEAQSLTWHNATNPLHESFTNLTLAGFDSTAWFIGLPGNWTHMIYQSVDHNCGFLFCEIDCELRHKMPNFTLGLGGHDFTLTPWDYVVEVMAPGKQRVCLFNFYPTDGNFPVDAIVLGKPFMEAFYK